MSLKDGHLQPNHCIRCRSFGSWWRTLQSTYLQPATSSRMTRMKWDAMSCNENVASECFRDNWAWWDDAQVLLQVSFLSCQAPLKFELVGMLLGWHHSCWASWRWCYGKLDFISSELWCVALFSLVQLCWVPASILGCIWTCCKLWDEETSSRLYNSKNKCMALHFVNFE